MGDIRIHGTIKLLTDPFTSEYNCFLDIIFILLSMYNRDDCCDKITNIISSTGLFESIICSWILREKFSRKIFGKIGKRTRINNKGLRLGLECRNCSGFSIRVKFILYG